MFEISSRKRLVFAACSLLFPVAVLAVTYWLDAAGMAPHDEFSAEMRTMLRVGWMAIMAVDYALFYFMLRRMRAMHERPSSFLGPLERQLVVYGLSAAFTPVLLAVLLFIVGDPLIDVLYGAIVGVIAAIIWSFRVLRAEPDEGN